MPCDWFSTVLDSITVTVDDVWRVLALAPHDVPANFEIRLFWILSLAAVLSDQWC